MQTAIAHFEEKGQTELPFVEAQYKQIQQTKGDEAANAYLTGYTSDFAGAKWLTSSGKCLHEVSK